MQEFQDKIKNLPKVAEGITVIVGESGSGKSVLLHKVYQENQNKINTLMFPLSRTKDENTANLSFLELTSRVELVVIEFPELGLDYQQKLKVIKTLTDLANQGVKIVFSTHSSDLIQELNNLIMLNDINPEKLKESEAFMGNEGIPKSSILSPKLLTAYQTKVDGVPHKIKVNRFGMYSQYLDNQFENQSNRGDEIYYNLIND